MINKISPNVIIGWHFHRITSGTSGLSACVSSNLIQL